MRNDAIRLAAVSAAGIIFWCCASAILATQEPWDSPDYLVWFLGAICLAVVCGWAFDRRAWCWGPLIMFGQVPILLAHSGIGPLIGVGIGFIALQSIPACFASVAGAKAKQRSLRHRP
jgi:hypothetical protein